MKIKNILLVHKKSAFELFGRRKNRLEEIKRTGIFKEEKGHFIRSHKVHYETLAHIENVLKEKGLKYKKVFRDRNVQYKKYDLIITVGGDGTFLKAIERTDRQYILGVNSAEEFSVGQLCEANPKNFKKVIERILAGQFSVSLTQRIELLFSANKEKYLALNDCLIAHQNPAHMSRYILRVGKKMEKQRSSGIWVSTAIGSTGAIKSAGGRVLKSTDKKFQYLPRELYTSRMNKHQLKGGVLASRGEIIVTSLMHHGVVYIDGARVQVKFPFGSQVRIKLSNKPIRRIKANL